jgi:hypothetical protein
MIFGSGYLITKPTDKWNDSLVAKVILAFLIFFYKLKVIHLLFQYIDQPAQLLKY